jgi:small subunit ribosomal protein S27Ae
MAADKKPAAAPAKKKAAASGRFQLYEKSGNGVKAKNRVCPKCGPGFFMGAHKNRIVCGKCGYTEILTAPAK